MEFWPAILAMLGNLIPKSIGNFIAKTFKIFRVTDATANHLIFMAIVFLILSLPSIFTVQPIISFALMLLSAAAGIAGFFIKGHQSKIKSGKLDELEVALRDQIYKHEKLNSDVRISISNYFKSLTRLNAARALISEALQRRSTGTPLGPETQARAVKFIREALTSYNEIFTTTVGQRCRLCIKLIYTTDSESGKTLDPDSFYVYTLSRDDLSWEENKHHDKKRKESNEDPLKENSDFLKLWHNNDHRTSEYFSNDILSESGYRSTSYRYWSKAEDLQYGPGEQQTNLWYRSTIVWPISEEVDEALGISKPTHHGFLCVDSASPGAFEKALHAPLGKAFATALYPVLCLYSELLE